MSEATTFPQLGAGAYRWPVVLAAGGLAALAIATAAAPLYATLNASATAGDSTWFPLVGALFGGGFWIAVAAVLFALARKKAEPIRKRPREDFRYSKTVSWLLLIGGMLVLAKNLWWIMSMPVGEWATWHGAVNMMFIADLTMFALWCLWTARLRATASGFGGPATIAALVFLAHGLWPWAAITLVIYLVVRKNEGRVVKEAPPVGL